MTLDEAKKVAEVASRADGGCIVCAFSLASEFKDRLPTFDWFQLVGTAGGWSDGEIDARRSDHEEEARARAEWKELHEEETDG